MQSIQVSGKDTVIFAKKANHEIPSRYELPPPPASEERRGVLSPDGSINWSCPCLGGLPYGPCGFEFREFFGCLPQFSGNDSSASSSPEKAEQDELKKQDECYPKFDAMRKCFSQFPKLYPPDEKDSADDATALR